MPNAASTSFSINASYFFESVQERVDTCLLRAEYGRKIAKNCLNPNNYAYIKKLVFAFFEKNKPFTNCEINSNGFSCYLKNNALVKLITDPMDFSIQVINPEKQNSRLSCSLSTLSTYFCDYYDPQNSYELWKHENCEEVYKNIITGEESWLLLIAQGQLPLYF